MSEREAGGFPIEVRKAPLVARGFVVFVNIRPNIRYGSWICDECYARVTRSRFDHHTTKEH